MSIATSPLVCSSPASPITEPVQSPEEFSAGEKRRVLVTGASGQDGSYLCEQLLDGGDRVWGAVRRRSDGEHQHLRWCMNHPNFTLADGVDMTDGESLRHVVRDARPHEVYNLAALSFVGQSWELPEAYMEVNYGGFVRLMEAVRRTTCWPSVYQASTSEMFGNAGVVTETWMSLVDGSFVGVPLTERDNMLPRSPYGVSKLAAHRMAAVYRQSYDMPIYCGICFNHESERRGPEFVTRKIAKGVANIATGNASKIVLGSLTARRDWGYAPDFTRGMVRMMRNARAGDYVLATGHSRSVRDFLVEALKCAGLDADHPESYVQTSDSLMRPAEIFILVGDAGAAKCEFGWEPTTSFEDMVLNMVSHEMERAMKGNGDAD